MNKQHSLMFFGAHPDDETFGMGTTLAHYVQRGAKVYYVCSTGGEEGTVVPEHMKGHSSVAELRRGELIAAVKVLGLADVRWLGYRDSGMAGSASNKHPQSMAAAPIDEVTGRMVKIIRELKPDVIITHDASGGYGHPDHIATHNAAVKAFHAAGDPRQYPQAGPAFRPHKIYSAVRPHGLMKVMVKLMPLFGQDPHHFGRNKDMDLTQRLVIEYPVHATVRPSKKAREIQARASACHASQGGGVRRRMPFLMRVNEAWRRRQECFMREAPPPTRRREKDLFEGLPQEK